MNLRRLGGFNFLLLLGLVIVLVAIGAWPGALIVVATLGVLGLGQAVLGRRALARRAEIAHQGLGFWCGRVYPGYPAPFGEGNRWAAWIYSPYPIPTTITSDFEGLTFTPSRGARRLGRLQPLTLPWTDVVAARSKDLGRVTPDDKISFTPLTQVDIVVTGELVPWFARPDWERALDEAPDDHEAEDEPLTAEERAELFAGFAEMQRDLLGPDGQLGTVPIVFTTDRPEGLVDLIATRARGRP